MRQRDRETRERVLKAAAQLFADRGFKKVTVRDICRAFHEAGVGTLDIGFHWGITSYEQQLRSMTLFAEHVIPDGRNW